MTKVLISCPESVLLSHHRSIKQRKGGKDERPGGQIWQKQVWLTPVAGLGMRHPGLLSTEVMVIGQMPGAAIGLGEGRGTIINECFWLSVCPGLPARWRQLIS